MTRPDHAVSARALALFDEWIEIAADERAQRLQALANTDPALAAAVEGLLAADAGQSGLLDRGVVGIAHTLLTELGKQDGEAQAVTSGTRIAAFTLTRQLGSGGMGEVWLAQRRDGQFVQEVALKLLKRGMDSDELSRRFMRERRILAELNHPHIAGFIDGGISADGRLYFAMEFVDGVPITTFARDRELNVRARIQLLVAVCEAVAYAQSHLVVHRDLKPSNILIDESGQPRVLDFGIAKLIGESVADTALTASGLRLLSPAYAAPEQVLDEAISTATDVYSLGVMAFELLTGVLPHVRSGKVMALAEQVRNEIAAAPSDVLRAAATHTNATGSGISQQRAAREVDGDLDVIVTTALKREPDRRYANAAALADDLKRWLEGRPIAAQADTAGYRLRKFVGRNRLAVGSASAVLLALIAGFGIALWQASVARDQAMLAHREAERAEAQTLVAEAAAARTRRVKDFMMQTFIQADPLHREQGPPKSVAEAFEDAVARVDSELQGDPVLQVDVLDDFSEIRTGQGRFDDARALNARALALAEATYPADHPAIAEALVNRASIESYSGNDFSSVKVDLQRAISILESHAEADPTDLANALSGLAAMYQQSGESDKALPLLERSIQLWRQHKKAGSEGLAVALHNTASTLLDRSRFAEAETFEEEALAEMIRIGGEHTPRLEPILDVLSQIQYRRGETERAIATTQRRLSLVTENFDGPHPWTASVLTDIGRQLTESQPEKAAENLDAAIAMYRTLDSAMVLMPLRYRALLARKQAGDAAARAYFDQAVDECARRKLDHLLCDVVRANRAGLIARLGDGALAMQEVDAAMASMRVRGADSDNEYAQALESKAVAQKALGQRDAAIATQTEALSRYITLFGAEHEEAVRARRNLDKLRE